MAELIQPVRGMNDVLPDQAPFWDRLESTAAELFASYGYQRVRLPVLERTELFSRSMWRSWSALHHCTNSCSSAISFAE